MPRQKQNVSIGQIPGEEIFDDDSTAVLVPTPEKPEITTETESKAAPLLEAMREPDPEPASAPPPPEQISPPAVSTAPPMVDTRPGCPSCASKALGIAGGMRICNDCGFQWA